MFYLTAVNDVLIRSLVFSEVKRALVTLSFGLSARLRVHQYCIWHSI
jgi:hypothetical protein